MCRLGTVLLLVAFGAACSCGDYTSGEPAVSVVTVPLRVALDAWVGDEASREVVVRNDGHHAATLAVEGAPEEFTVEPAELAVPAGGEATLVVSFRPTAAGSRDVELALTRRGHVEARLPVAARGIEPALEVPASLDFGPVVVGERKGVQLRVTNPTELEVEAPAIVVEGPDAAAFAAMFPVGRIAPRSDAILDVAFAPLRRGPSTASVSVAACAGCTPRTIALAGAGLDCEVVPVPARLDFGVISPGGTRTLELGLENRGERTARIASARIADPAFQLQAQAWPIVLAPGESRQVWVTFAPTAIGDRAAVVEFLEETRTLATAALAVHGGGAVLEVDESLDLGQRPLGWSGYGTTVVRNVGEALATQLTAGHVEGSTSWSLEDPPAGLEVGLHPGTIRLAFSGRAVGRADGELVLATSDPEQPELRIPLRAEVVAQPSCQVRAGPDPLRFGLVKRGARHLRELLVESVGQGPCLVFDLGMAPGSDPDFSVATDRPFLELAPGASVRVPVAFAPDALPNALQRGTVTWRTSNPAAPPGAVEVTGYAADVDLVVVPNPVDFGRVPLDRAPHKTFRVENHGGIGATLTGQRLAAGSSPRITVSGGPSYPAALAPNATVPYEVHYAPLEVGRDRAEVELQVAGYAEPVIAAILGEGHDGPCGDYCDPPVPICPGPLTTLVRRQVSILGSATDPQGDPVTCAWRIASAPEGSAEQPSPPDACATSIAPDVVGEYVLELTATDDLGNAASCTTDLRVIPPEGGLWVEMYWEDNVNDVDLHLLHGGGGDPHVRSNWNKRPWDCYYSNKHAQWDAPGPEDDGNLDFDRTAEPGVENIRVDQPSTTHDYHVGLIWYAKKSPPTTQPVVVNVYCWGLPVANTTTTLVFSSVSQAAVMVGTVRVQNDSTCVWTPDGSTIP
jgi:hypothetical protein